MIKNKLHNCFYSEPDQRFIGGAESEKRIDVFYQKHTHVL